MTIETTKQMFKEWGLSCRLFPDNNEALKERVISRLTIPLPRARRSFLFFLPRPTVVFAILAILALFIDPAKFYPWSASLTDQSKPLNNVLPESVVQNSGAKRILEFYPYPSPEIPVVDSREFMKINYSASMRTRHIEELTRHIQTAVRGFGGRVDGATSSARLGYVSFAVPADHFEAFKEDIGGLVGKRFFSEEIATQNLLPQKRVIEQNKNEIEKKLSDLRANRNSLTRNHTKTVAFIKSQLKNIDKELDDLQTELLLRPERNTEIAARQQIFLAEKDSFNTKLDTENTNYAKNLSFVDADIKNEQKSLETANTQDKDLLDNVATVNGYISLRWISIWGIFGAYLPEYWISWLLIIVAVLWYLFHRRRSRLAIP